MLKIVLHAGFHKSGTTSIQQALSTLNEPKIVYPPTLELGPGHAYLARVAGNPNRHGYDPGVLTGIANHYQRILDPDTSSILVLSSEDFSTMESLEGLKAFAQTFPVHLLITRRPVPEALPSWQQEMIKQGSRWPYLSKEGLAAAAQHMQFHPVKIQHFMDYADFSQITVISTTLENPDFLFRSFGAILGCRLKSQVLNQRISQSSMALMTRLNEVHPELSVDESMVASGAFSEPRNPSDQLHEISMVRSWKARERRLLRYFRHLSRKSEIVFLESP